MTRIPVAPVVARAGAPGAQKPRTLGDLYDRFGSTAYSLALSITNDHTTAENVVTAAFAQNWRDFSTAPPPESEAKFFGALMTSVRSAAMQARNSDKSARVSFENQGRQRGGSLEAAVATALADLPDIQQRVLALAYFGGLGVGAIASELREPMDTVKSNLQAAMRHLRSVLAARSGGAVPV